MKAVMIFKLSEQNKAIAEEESEDLKEIQLSKLVA
jgi:hypothetical protein